MNKWRLISMLEAIKTACLLVMVLFIIGMLVFNPTIEPPLKPLLIVLSTFGLPIVGINVLIDKVMARD